MSGRGRRGGLKSRGGGGALTLDQRFTMMASNTQAMRQNMVNARCVFSLPHSGMPEVIFSSLILNVTRPPQALWCCPKPAAECCSRACTDGARRYGSRGRGRKGRSRRCQGRRRHHARRTRRPRRQGCNCWTRRVRIVSPTADVLH